MYGLSREQFRKEVNLIKLFEERKDKINWDYFKKFKSDKIPDSFRQHFNLYM